MQTWVPLKCFLTQPLSQAHWLVIVVTLINEHLTVSGSYDANRQPPNQEIIVEDIKMKSEPTKTRGETMSDTRKHLAELKMKENTTHVGKIIPLKI